MKQGQDQRETVLSSKTVFGGKVITVETWQVALPDGREAGREIVLHLGAAAVVPVDHRGWVTLVRQHRVAIDQMTLEIPAGKLDFPGEDPFACAKRELEEETGLQAAKWTKLAHVVTTPGFCTERIALYLATDLSQVQAHTDPDEFLSLVHLPLSEAIGLIATGAIIDAKTCLGLLMAQRELQLISSFMAREEQHSYGKRKDSFPTAQGGIQ